jgi:hypothetical protein
MTYTSRNKLTLLTLHENYFCPFCGENSYKEGKIKSCEHLKFIWRERDGDSENALIYATDDVRKILSEEDADHFQIYEVLCLKPPFKDAFTIEENFDFDDEENDDHLIGLKEDLEKKYGFSSNQVLSLCWQH